MTLSVEYKCEQTNNSSIYVNLAQENIKHIRNMNNKHMQDTKHKWERKISNRKYRRFVSSFEHTCSTSPPSTLEGFPLKSIPPDHSVPQHLQGVPTRTLGLSSPSLVPARTTHRKHASLPRPHLYKELSLELETIANTQVRLLKAKMKTLVITTL